MFRTIKISLLLITTLLLSSCIGEDTEDDCGIYLEFIYDYNMEYADSFDPQVKVVDVFVFDHDGKYLFTRHAECDVELIGRKRMYLSDNLELGKNYKILTVGGLCDKFFFGQAGGVPFVEGVTTIEEVCLSLNYESDHVSHEFPHLWYGQTVDIHYRADLSVWPVHLVKNTNKFTFILSRLDAESKTGSRTTESIPYTFEIVTPERAVYGYDNAPLIEETLTYHPYLLTPGETAQSLSVGHLNTMRLFDREEDYQLIIRSSADNEIVWDYDLMALLRETKPGYRPDGSTLPMQEYLDRKSAWEIIILHRGGDSESGAFLAVGVVINDWILWLHDIDL